MVKGQSRPQTAMLLSWFGGENRSGMNPGVVGSNPAADTIAYFCIHKLLFYMIFILGNGKMIKGKGKNVYFLFLKSSIINAFYSQSSLICCFCTK